MSQILRRGSTSGRESVRAPITYWAVALEKVTIAYDSQGGATADAKHAQGRRHVPFL